MKKDIHPEYRPVVFIDVSNKERYVINSTVHTSETIEHEGEEYPCVTCDITASSHPFYTGNQKLIDTEGRIDRFRTRYANVKKD